jgi:hypothetical protein
MTQIVPAEVLDASPIQRLSPGFGVDLLDWISPVTEHVVRMLSNLFA